MGIMPVVTNVFGIWSDNWFFFLTKRWVTVLQSSTKMQNTFCLTDGEWEVGMEWDGMSDAQQEKCMGSRQTSRQEGKWMNNGGLDRGGAGDLRCATRPIKSSRFWGWRPGQRWQYSLLQRSQVTGHILKNKHTTESMKKHRYSINKLYFISKVTSVHGSSVFFELNGYQ